MKNLLFFSCLLLLVASCTNPRLSEAVSMFKGKLSDFDTTGARYWATKIVSIEPASDEAKEAQMFLNSTVKREHVTRTVNTKKNKPVEQPSLWKYNEEADPMTDKVRYFAEVKGNNLLYFDFPYSGGSTMGLMIRKMDGQNEVILRIDRGQFSSPYNDNVKLRFDGGKILSYGFSSAADGSSDYIFLDSPSQIISKLKKSKTVKIEAPFFQAGQQVVEFDVQGLVWKH